MCFYNMMFTILQLNHNLKYWGREYYNLIKALAFWENSDSFLKKKDQVRK